MSFIAASMFGDFEFTLKASLYSVTARVESAVGPGNGNMAAEKFGLDPMMPPIAADGPRNITACSLPSNWNALMIVSPDAPGWKQPALFSWTNSWSAVCQPAVPAKVTLPAARSSFQFGLLL